MGSETKTSATNHSGWGTQDGRIYNDSTCRSGSSNATYYVYTYGFATLGAADTVTGVRIKHHIGSASGPSNGYDIQLSNATAKQGTAKTGLTMTQPVGCGSLGLKTEGSSSDLWGMSAAALKTLINNSNFGVALDMNGFGANSMYEDGFEITVYYITEETVDITRGSEVAVARGGNITRESRVEVVEVEDYTRRSETTVLNMGVTRASVTAVAVEGELTRGVTAAVRLRDDALLSSSDGTALEGNGSEWDNWNTALNFFVATCASKTNSTQALTRMRYEHSYASSKIAGHGILVQAKWSAYDGAPAATPGTLQLTTGTSPIIPVGTAKIVTVPAATTPLCTNALISDVGSDSDRWGLSEAAFQSWIRDDTKGVRFTPTGTATHWIYISGFNVIVYYSDATDYTRESRVAVAVTDEPTRESRVAIDNKGVTRESRVTILNAGWNRSSKVTIQNDGDTRESRVAIQNLGVTRESRVTIQNDGWTREGRVSTAVTDEFTRESRVAVITGPEITRAAVVFVPVLENQTRSVEVFVVVNWVYEHPTRRAEVFVGGFDWTRRSELAVAVTKGRTRGAEVHVSSNEHTRRVLVDVYTEPWFTGDEERRSAVTVDDWDPTRRAMVTVSGGTVNEDKQRRSIVSIPDWEPRRRSIVTVLAGYIIGDEERRAVMAVADWDPTRRSIVTVSGGIVNEEWTRRALVTVYSPDQTRRALVTVTHVFSGEATRSSSVYVEVASYTRSSEVTVATTDEPTRRVEVTVAFGYILEEPTRRAVVTAWALDHTRRAMVTVTEVFQAEQIRSAMVTVGIPEYTRRAMVTVVSAYLIKSPTRLAMVTVGISEYTRRSEITISSDGYTRASKVDIYARWFYGWTGRQSTVVVAVEDEATRRVEMFTVLGDEPTRESIVYAAVAFQATRLSTVVVPTPLDLTRRSLVYVYVHVRPRIRSVLSEY